MPREIDVQDVLKAARFLDAAAVSSASRSIMMSVVQMTRIGMTRDQIELAMREEGLPTESGTIFGYDLTPPEGNL